MNGVVFSKVNESYWCYVTSSSGSTLSAPPHRPSLHNRATSLSLPGQCRGTIGEVCSNEVLENRQGVVICSNEVLGYGLGVAICSNEVLGYGLGVAIYSNEVLRYGLGVAIYSNEVLGYGLGVAIPPARRIRFMTWLWNLKLFLVKYKTKRRRGGNLIRLQFILKLQVALVGIRVIRTKNR